MSVQDPLQGIRAQVASSNAWGPQNPFYPKTSPGGKPAFLLPMSMSSFIGDLGDFDVRLLVSQDVLSWVETGLHPGETQLPGPFGRRGNEEGHLWSRAPGSAVPPRHSTASSADSARAFTATSWQAPVDPTVTEELIRRCRLDMKQCHWFPGCLQAVSGTGAPVTEVARHQMRECNYQRGSTDLLAPATPWQSDGTFSESLDPPFH